MKACNLVTFAFLPAYLLLINLVGFIKTRNFYFKPVLYETYTEKIMTFWNWVFVFSIWGCTQFKYKILWKKLMLRKASLILSKRTWIDRKILSLRKCVLQFPTWELIFSLWVTDKLKNELIILIIGSREFRSANETRQERP